MVDSAGRNNNRDSGKLSTLQTDETRNNLLSVQIPDPPKIKKDIKRALGWRKEYYFDRQAARRATHFFQNDLQHIKGDKAGQRFILEKWQWKTVRRTFGWKRKKDGLRKHRRVWIEVPKGNGKTPLGAGFGMYLFAADKEPGSEVICAAADKEQASIAYEFARENANRNPKLKKLVGRAYRRSMAILSTMSSFKVVSSEAKGKHGTKIHGLILDEVHAIDDREYVETLISGTAKRPRSLIVMLTTAGYDPLTICYDFHQHACKVRDGILDDPELLAVIFAAEEKTETETISSFNAIRRMNKICTCSVDSGLIIKNIWNKIWNKYHSLPFLNEELRNVKTTQIEKSEVRDYAEPAMSDSSSIPTQNEKKEPTPIELIGQSEIQKKENLPPKNGEISQAQSDICITTGSEPITGLLENNTTSSRQTKITNAESAKTKKDFALTIATIQAQLGASYVPNAIQQSAYSEILKAAYSLHSDTCEVKLKSKIENQTLVFTHDYTNWKSEATWRKANPNYDITIMGNDLASQCKLAEQMPSYENSFKRLFLNIWTTQDIRWLPMTLWDANDTKVDFETYKRRPCYAGLDLASVSDIAALVLAFPEDDGTISTLCRFWVPAETAVERQMKTNIPYADWIKQGYMIGTEGNAIDFDFIRKEINELAQTFSIQELAIDRNFNAFQISTQLTGDGLTVVPFGQGYFAMTAPSRYLETLLLKKMLNHSSNPILRWMASNAAAEQDAAGNIKPSKKKSKEKIDGIVALVMAIGRLIVQNDTKSVYETRGIIML